MGAKELIGSDLYRIYGCSYKQKTILQRLKNEGSPQVICIKLFRKANNRFVRFLYNRYSMRYQIEIQYGTQIGFGLYLPHTGRRVINKESVIGNNVTIHPGVTIGKEIRGKREGCPTIGDRVWIGANSVIVGGGDNRS